MNRLPSIRFIQKLAWLIFVCFGLLLVWQGLVYATDAYPDHIMPVVRLVCRLFKTGHVVPYAYTWTIYLGVLSTVGFIGSGVVLGLIHFLERPARA